MSSHNPVDNNAPPWLANLNEKMQQIIDDMHQMRDDITHLQRRSDEMPILLANSHAGCRGSLLNPTAIANGWAPMLGPPNPTTRDELFEFTDEQCIASAANLGLPLLAAQTPVLERRRQIAIKIGVSIE